MSTVGSDSSGTSTSLRRYKFREAVRTDIGLRRNENQDAYGIAHTASTSLFIVADGMGGARGGATASAIAVNVIANTAIKENGMITRPSLKTAIEQANAIIFNRSKHDEDLSGMGTTVVALAFVNECAIVAHVGDSRIYRYSKGKITQLTHDHTLVQELVDTGAIPIEEAENHPIAHMLTRSLGPTDGVEVEIQALADPTEQGDRFLLCSDGLYNLVTEEEMQEHLGNEDLDSVVESLVDLALERGGTDNVTVEVLEVRDSDDDSFSAEYPPDGEVRIALSDGVNVGDIEDLLKQLEVSEEEEAADIDVNAATQTDLEVVLDGDLTPDEVGDAGPLVEKESRGDLLRIQAGVFFVIGLTAGIFLYSIFQYKKYGAESALFSSSTKTAEVTIDEAEREQLARELETWVNDDAVGPGPEGLPPAEIPEFPADALPSDAPSGMESTMSSTTAEDPTISEQVEDLQVPPPPSVEIKNDLTPTEKPNRPIVWENEQKRVERLLEELAAQQTPTEVAGLALPPPPPAETLLTKDEIAKVIYDKNMLRERIADLDAKLRTLSLETKSEAESLLSEMEKRIDELNTSIENRAKKVQRVEQQVQIWRDYRDQAVGKRTIRFADPLLKYSEELKTVKTAYDKSSVSYFQSFDRWQEQPNDVERAAEMGARGRELQQAQIALEKSVRDTIAFGLHKAAVALARLKIEQSAAETERDKLSRHEGYLRAFTTSTATRRRELQRSYLEERKNLEQKLSSLEAKVTGVQEVKFRQTILVEAVTKR